MTHLLALSTTIILLFLFVNAKRTRVSQDELQSDDKRTRVSQDELQSDEQADEQSSDTEEDSAYCWRIKEYFRKERAYHFQIGEADQNGTAFQLVRNKKDPQLNLCKNCEWKVSFQNDKILWDMDFVGKDQEGKMELSIFRDVAYIKRSADPSEDDLEIVLTNGERESIKGGIYYPEEVMYAGLRKYVSNATFQIEADAIIEKTTAGDAARAKMSKTFGKATAAGTVVGGSAGTTFGALFGLAFSSFSFWGPGQAAAVGVVTTLSNMAVLGSFGLVLGVGGGVIGGAVVGGAIASSGGLKRWVQARRDLGLTASEKLFQELKCLRGMNVCGNGDIIYPSLSQCPE